MEDKNIKVLFLKNYNSQILKLCKQRWIEIEDMLLKKGYTIQRYYIDNKYFTSTNNCFSILKKINEGIYNIIVFPYDKLKFSFYKNENYDINFTDTVFIQKQLILYKLKKKFRHPFYILYRKLFKLWSIFIIIFLTLSLFFYFFDREIISYNNSFHHYFIFFLGADKNFLLNKQNIYSCIFFILISLFIYILNLILNNLTLSKSAIFSIPKNSINRDIYKQKILITENRNLINLLTKSKAIPIVRNKTNIEILKDYMKDDSLDGVILELSHFENYKIDNNTILFNDVNISLNISEKNFTYISYSFPITKNKKMYQEINNFLQNYKKGMTI